MGTRQPVRAERCGYMKGRLAPRCGRKRAVGKMSARLQPLKAESCAAINGKLTPRDAVASEPNS